MVSSAIIFQAGVIIKTKQAKACKGNIGFGNAAFIKYKARFALKKADKGDFNHILVKQKLDTGYKSIKIVIKIQGGFNKSKVSDFVKIFKFKKPN